MPGPGNHSPGEYRDRPVRSYVVTGGRASPSRNTVRPETIVSAVRSGASAPVTAGRTERALLGMCRELLSLVEAAAHLDLPVSVVMVVASDLIDSGHLAVRTPATRAPANLDLLEELLHGLRQLV